ncbi:MAG: acyltransferase [Patescibacteria group bacterium]|nr:acyltransferase [Patescibacteria group bacterium]MCL5432267.1 acyltransferase [Patescibacteria group bacterium]
MPKYKPEIDILKATAIIAVVLIHVSAAYMAHGYDLINLTVNQAARFAVPVFVALSSFGLAGKYLATKLELKDFFVRRALRLLPWFFFWEVIIFVTVTYVLRQSWILYDGLPLWKIFILGKADYHLYFVPMIFVLYLFFPILLQFIKRFPKLTLLAAFLFQIYWYWQITTQTELLSNRNNVWTDQMQYLNPLTWIFYFVFGMFLARAKSYKLQAISLVALLVGLVWTVASSGYLMSSGFEITVATRFTRFPVLLYSIGVILSGLLVLPSLPLTRLPTFLTRLGKLSLLVYLCHTLVLRAVPLTFPEPIVFILVLAGSYLIAEVCSHISFKRPPLVKLLAKN